MRAILFVLILVVAALILAIASGYLDIDQTQPVKVPQIETGDGGISTSGGQLPSFDVETGSVSVEAAQRNTTIPVPSVTVEAPEEQQAQQNAVTANSAGE